MAQAETVQRKKTAELILAESYTGERAFELKGLENLDAKTIPFFKRGLVHGDHYNFKRLLQ